jgi:FkbM family methyltransferase
MSFTCYYDKNKPFIISPLTKILTPHTFLQNGDVWEKESIHYFFDLIDDQKNNIILDIGAQSGLYSLYAKYKPQSQFYSYEPFVTTFNLLNDNLRLNEIANVKTFNLAMSDKKGKSILNTCISHNGLHTMGNTPLRFKDVHPVEVITSTIDIEFYDKNIPVDYIKIDTEGHEYFILKGGMKTIKLNKPLIQLEWNKINMMQSNVSEKMLEDLIIELNYKKKILIGEELIITPA